MKEEMYMNGILYRNYNEVMKTGTPIKPDFEIATMDDGTYLVQCANCHRIKHLLMDPFNLIPDGSYPLISCPHCGMHLFNRTIESVRKKIRDKGWTKKEVENLGFDYDLIMDEHRDKTLDIIRGLRQ